MSQSLEAYLVLSALLFGIVLVAVSLLISKRRIHFQRSLSDA